MKKKLYLCRGFYNKLLIHMKKISYLLLLLVAIVGTSCSTYQYTGRQVDVMKRSIGMSDQMAGIDVNFNKQVTATSDYQLTRKDAIEEAEFQCIQNSKIDVVVDPIVKVEYNPFKAKKRYKATIIGYAGTYKEAPTALDKSKEYTLEDIEKYKLLTDPSFPQYYYNNGALGDNYYFGEQGVRTEKQSASLVVKNVAQKVAKHGRAPKVYDFHKSQQLRDAGLGLTGIGVASMIGIGVGCYIGGLNTRPFYDGGIKYDYNFKAVSAGIAFMVIGAAEIVSGVTIASVGAARMKKAQKMDITLNAGGNGIGLGLTF